MNIAQALFKTWLKEKQADTDSCKIAPLEHYLKLQYDERYIKLCHRLGIEPVSFTQWLRKDIETVK